MASAVVEGYIMIVMEYLSGGSLQDMLTNFTSEIPITCIQRYMQDICRGLDFLYVTVFFLYLQTHCSVESIRLLYRVAHKQNKSVSE